MTATIIEATTPRLLPRLTPENRAFWTGGGEGRLLILRCERCEWWIHPPVARCPSCDGDPVAAPVSGRGTVFTFTVNAHQYHPDVPPPNLIALVELVEQPGLRVATNIIGCDPDAVRIGLPVRVAFEHHGEIYVPLFEPVDAGA